MPTLTDARISQLLAPYFEGSIPSDTLLSQLSTYLDLLLRWNARTNLTAIREPETIVARHFGESLFAARHLQPLVPAAATILDFGSGAGFPGIPIQLFLTEAHVTLAESQGKKASFLREVVRTLELPQIEVWHGRVEAMGTAPGHAQRFNAVTLRAVDDLDAALTAAREKVADGGWLLTLSSRPAPERAELHRLLPQSQSSYLTLQRLPHAEEL